ncbi:hypothetical protein ACX27_26825 [Nostoc piscinale CENA21]|uniref:Uncharacterized protein n=1 Tax=Nostoc piscinale CENA21 TaxID=224013 RepID=A0A0M3V6H2_9NOSO|nr:hypothetical protein [Nostoc piscinale]ALF55643.1 hypothetical protein ACX27_26825 [Nostoc piscinale CENA21]
MIHDLEGNSIEIVLTRKQVAEELGITTNVLFILLAIAILYLPRFQRLKTKNGDGISRKRPLTNWDLDSLRRLLHTYKIHGKIQTRVLVSQNIDYYNI